ncbi:hypothetical protein TYRP_008801, partial [Tyrophagus putrescentiae]
QQHSSSSSADHRARGAAAAATLDQQGHNSQAAIDEINEALRDIFPIVPHKNHIILTRNQKLWYTKEPSSRVVKQSSSAEQFLADSSSLSQQQQISQQQQQQLYKHINSNPFFFRGGGDQYDGGVSSGDEETAAVVAAALEPTGTSERTRVHLQQLHSMRPPSISEIFRSGSGRGEERMGVAQQQQQQLSPEVLSVLEQEEMMPSLIGGSFSSSSSSAGEPLLPILQQQRQQTAHSSASSASSDNRPVAQGRLGPRPHPPPPPAPVASSKPTRYILRGKGGRPEGQTVRIPVKQPELTTPPLFKRGPECMRRCIMQGQLHPVQCHSLC